MTSMRIVQLIDSLAAGGAERLQVTFAEAAVARGFQPTTVALHVYPNTPVPAQLRAAGARLIELRGRSLFDPVRLIGLMAALRRAHCQVIHAHLTYSIILGVVAGYLLGIPVVVTLHNTQPDRWARLERMALQYGAAKIIAVGVEVAEAYQSNFRSKTIEVILNAVKSPTPITAEQRLALRTHMAGDPSRPLLIAVGRLEPQKGYADLLTAIQQVRQTHPVAALAIVGVGTLREEIANRIVALGLQDCVRLLGPREDVPSLLLASDLFVSAALWEGLPVSILEAMAAGLPVVATRVGEVPQVVTAAAGVLVQPGRPSELAEALRRLLDAPLRWHAFGRAGHDYVIQNHDPGRWFEQHLVLYQALVPGEK